MAKDNDLPDDATGSTSSEITTPSSGYTEVSADPDKPREDETGKVAAVEAEKKAETARTGKGGGAKIIAGALAGLLLVAAIAAAVFFFLQYKSKSDEIDANESARQAACEYGSVLGNYDYQNLDKYINGVLDGAEGDFKKEFGDTSKDFRSLLTEGQVKTSTNDIQCAIKSGDSDDAEAIVVVGQTVTSLATQNKPQPTQISMVMSMHNDDGRWLVNKLSSPLLEPK